ncbi:MAG: MFS transporter [Proteobacteria bacterium]|nr:MAG: MFS transporter [Pseudomonadota bacterium]
MDKQKLLAGLNASAFTGSQIALVPLFAYLAERLGLPLAQVLVAFALGSAIFVWGSPYWAQKSDAVGRARILFVGAAGLGASLATLSIAIFFGSGMAPYASFGCLIASRLLYGVCASAMAPVAQAWQSDLNSADEQNAAMARHSLFLSAGRLGALLLVVALAAHPEILLLGLTGSAAVLAVLNSRAAARAVPAARAARIQTAPPSLLLVWPIFALAFFFTSSVELVNSSLSGLLQQIFGLTSGEAARFVGQLLLTASAIVMLSQIAARNLLRRSWRTPLIAGLLFLAGGAATLLASSSRAEVWIALGLISVALGLIPPSYLSALAGTDVSRSERGKAAGFLASTQTLGYAAGALLSAASFHFFPGDRGPALLLTVAIAMGAGLYLLARARRPEGTR